MMKLSEQFATIRGNMLMMQSLPKVTEAYRMFAQEEKCKEISQMTSNTKLMAFLANRKKFNNTGMSMDCRGQKTGGYQKQNNYSNFKHFVREKKVSKPGSKYYCTHYEIPGHSVDRCFKIYDYIHLTSRALRRQRLQQSAIMIQWTWRLMMILQNQSQ